MITAMGCNVWLIFQKKRMMNGALFCDTLAFLLLYRLELWAAVMEQ